MKLTHGGDWAGYQTEYGSLPLDFSANVSPLGLPDGVRDAAVRALDASDRYPDPLCRRLRENLAQHHSVPEAQIVCGNGAADLIDRICRALRPKKALLTAPDFSEYESALAAADCGIQVLTRPAADGFRLDPERFAGMVRGAELLFLSNPNNPTGLLQDRDTMLHILQSCREVRCVPVIDECFLDFTDRPEAYSLVPLLSDWPELVILRAFTKTWAMAGLRLGYALCGSAAFAARLQRTGQPWPVSNVAQEAGIAALEETAYRARLRKLISRERPRVQARLSGLGLHVVPGTANYLLFQSADPDLERKLRERGILIRDCRNYQGLTAGWYRTAIRTKEENDRLLKTMEEVLCGTPREVLRNG